VTAGGISVMVSGGRRCRRHPHLDGQRAPSALLLVVSKRRSMTAVFDRRYYGCSVVSLFRTSKEPMRTSSCMNWSMLKKIRCKFWLIDYQGTAPKQKQQVVSINLYQINRQDPAARDQIMSPPSSSQQRRGRVAAGLASCPRFL
jgi:hypothetical protein